MPRPIRLTPNGNFYLKVRNPADLRRLGAPEFTKRSLGTKDEDEAITRHSEMLASVRRGWEVQRKGPQPIPLRQLVALSGRIYREFMDVMHDEAATPGMWDDVIRLSEGKMAKPGGAEEWYGDTVNRVLAEDSVLPDADSRTRLLDLVHRAVLLAAEQGKRRAQGDFGPDPNAERFPEVTKEVVTITSLLDLWEREHLANKGSPATPRDHRQKVGHFIAYLGHDDAQKVTPKDISDWCDRLRHEEGKSAKTVAGKYLSAVKAVFRMGKERFKIPVNPAAEVSRAAPRRVRERPDYFTDDEAAKILRMALVADMANGKTASLNKLACKWVPWLCAYTGARAGELAQLRGDDFYVERGADAIRITPEAGTVKTGQYRHVPLHPHLIELGILDMVQKRGNGPLFYVPNDNPREPNSTQWGNVRAKVGEWVRNTVGITDERIQPNHAWRHRFKAEARRAGIHREYTDAIQGHDDGTASVDYGDYPADVLLREIEKLPRYSTK